jgi:hypothetical protein
MLELTSMAGNCSYTLEEVKLLQKALMDNFNIETRLTKKRENQWLICIPVKQQPTLRAIVTPYMLYKISSSLIWVRIRLKADSETFFFTNTWH